ncbi:MAG: hypothetical protein ACRDP3_17770 [Streptomyces sp.]|uniref:hypothetical protein n=1 Tax=Streptomyces sp. TaxID=1931 RepID=UPI003D6AB0FD
MSDLSDLVSLCPPPGARSSTPTSSLDLRTHNYAVERKLLQSLYGGGCFNDFLWIYAPEHRNPHLSSESRTSRLHTVLQRRAASSIRSRIRELGFTIYDTVSWGGTDNGDLCCWLNSDARDSSTGLIIDCKEDAFFEYSGFTASLIHDLLVGKVTCPLFPDDFLDEAPSYHVPQPPDPFA